MRLRQIRRLVALQREYAAEFDARGRTLTRHAIFTMVLDCLEAGVPSATLAEVAGEPRPWGGSLRRVLRVRDSLVS